jgi:hypothetical protein
LHGHIWNLKRVRPGEIRLGVIINGYKATRLEGTTKAGSLDGEGVVWMGKVVAGDKSQTHYREWQEGINTEYCVQYFLYNIVQLTD